MFAATPLCSLPGGITHAQVVNAIDAILRAEDWDVITIKSLQQLLELWLLGESSMHKEALRPLRPFIRKTVDAAQQRILAEAATMHRSIQLMGALKLDV